MPYIGLLACCGGFHCIHGTQCTLVNDTTVVSSAVLANAKRMSNELNTKPYVGYKVS